MAVSSDSADVPCVEAPDAHNLVTNDHVRCLSEMLLQPRLSTRRCVEHLSFVPTGGHRWIRDLQICIPDGSGSPDSAWRVVSLGAYARRRFPDFMAVDAAGRTLSLVTREQHGYALTQSLTTRVLDELGAAGALDDKTPLFETDAYRRLWNRLYLFFTTSGQLSRSEKDETTEVIATLYSEVLTKIGLPHEDRIKFRDAFASEIGELLDITRYLCWVRAAPGETVEVRVTYTTRDPRRKLGRGTIAERLEVMWMGLSEPRSQRWKVWADWYRQFGLAPLNYEFSVPGSLHVGSYYFTMEPPLGTDVTYLDWEVGNSLETHAIDCSTLSAHIHNQPFTGRHRAKRGGTIRAYLHCAPQDHKLIVGAALLNCLFVYLVASGRIHGKTGSPAQSILLAAPSIYVAYLARQQRHYFADAMRRQRGILWWYLAFSVAFLITVAFGNHTGSLGSRGFSPLATAVVWAWGASSAFVAAWYFPLGGSYERVTESLARRRIEQVRKVERAASCAVPARSRASRIISALPGVRTLIFRYRWHRYDVIPAWKCYQREVRRYSTRIVRLMVAATAGMIVALSVFWHFPHHKPRTPKTGSRVVHTRTPSRRP
jgi:putative flippase GtrA